MCGIDAGEQRQFSGFAAFNCGHSGAAITIRFVSSSDDTFRFRFALIDSGLSIVTLAGIGQRSDAGF
jgi:hypothetical protein